jgi:hypothetical protein
MSDNDAATATFLGMDKREHPVGQHVNVLCHINIINEPFGTILTLGGRER